MAFLTSILCSTKLCIFNQAMAINVSSEVARLKGVLVHTPGPEMSLVRPGLKSELLFDDIIFEEDARAEHLDMLEVFRTIMGSDSHVYEIRNLLLECFLKSDAREYFVEELIKAFSSGPLGLLKSDLLQLSADELLSWAIEGSAGISHHTSLAHIPVHPIPNLLFTRDLAAVVGHQIILSRAATPARLRESILMDTLVHFHPLFESLGNSIIQLPSEQSIEGGDILVASEHLVLIGISERTSFAGVLQAAKPLLTGGVETVLAIDIPKQRASMHLDTIFTFASDCECVVYPPVIEHTANNVVALRLNGEQVVVESRHHIKEALEEFSGREYTFIACGGSGRLQQEREQWTDGANVFALAPGVIMGYDRNTHTFQRLKEHGYTYMKTREFLEEYRQKELDWSSIESGLLKLAIGFEGHELCRGRGGARCMTLPLERIKPHKQASV
jgi:arginine deiminase